jgi:hypothetical protein
MAQVRCAHLCHLRSTLRTGKYFSENLCIHALICAARLVVMRRVLPARKQEQAAGGWGL